MSNISKLEFVALNISGKGYSSWILDAEIHLNAMGLVDTIKDNNEASSQERAKAMIFLRHHLDEGLKMQYLAIKDPFILWNNLKDRYDHLKLVILPHARHLNLCGEDVTEHDKLEKTYFTFLASSMLLQQQYREMGFKKYSKLLSHLLIAEQHNDLLMKNHESRPVGSMSLPKVNQANYHQRERGRGSNRGSGRRINYNHDGRLAPKNDQQYKKNGKKQEVIQKKNSKSVCHRCGGMGHWSRTCRSSKRLVQLYQASLKKSDNNPEANFISKDNVELVHKMDNSAEVNFISEDNVEPMHLDVADFFVFSEGKTTSDDPAII
ncbi:hypothetical protein KY289_014091 [Solanum tuberosum]|nr:hypothetical protein KY289_014091 [Solanum tuberosum]